MWSSYFDPGVNDVGYSKNKEPMISILNVRLQFITYTKLNLFDATLVAWPIETTNPHHGHCPPGLRKVS